MVAQRSIEMKMDKEENLLEEIRRQALIRADQRRRQAELTRETRYTLEALRELTGLPRQELEAIAAEVKACNHQEAEAFFSVQNQLLMVSSGLALIGFFVWIFICLGI